MVNRAPVVFIHGLWIHASAWEPWIELFREAGYEPIAPGWPGDLNTVAATRKNASALANRGVAEITSSYADVIRELDQKPIVIGHSFGGLVAQKLLGDDLASAAVAIDSAAMKGVDKVTLPVIRSSFPVISKSSNKTRAVSLTEKQFRYGFGNTLSKSESSQLYEKFAIPGPALPLFELVGSKKDPLAPTAVNTSNSTRGPLLLTGGDKDHTVAEAVTRLEYERYADSGAITNYKVFANRGHSLVLDHGWREVADYTLAWLGRQSL
ncbi:alpha/beta hydrolase [Herbiconiux sp. P16]|uniref:alpha/beta hydrolase n=1 Tax=Herbiconiux wuyangfengii TaxID=3342794 RepID=UPI0035B780C3